MTTEKGTNEARQGTETHHVRWILGISTALAVIAFFVFMALW